jgi:hypothetical protein
MRSIRGLCRPTELYRPRTWLYRPNRSIWTEDVVRGRYTSVGRYKPRIDLIQKLQLLYY